MVKPELDRIIYFVHIFTFPLIIIIILSSIYLQYTLLTEYSYASSNKSLFENNNEGIITKVIDGDTLNIRTDSGNTMTIRLVLVDAPELNEAGYAEAREFVTENCLNRSAVVDPDNNQDLSYDRVVAVVYCNGFNINEAVLQSGFADIYGRFCLVSEFGISAWAQKHGCNAFTTRGNNYNSASTDKDEQYNSNITDKMLNNCDPSYPTICIPSSPPDLDCMDVDQKNFQVKLPDPHRFDGDKNGVGCEA
jgi:micrococcal nuclease